MTNSRHPSGQSPAWVRGRPNTHSAPADTVTARVRNHSTHHPGHDASSMKPLPSEDWRLPRVQLSSARCRSRHTGAGLRPRQRTSRAALHLGHLSLHLHKRMVTQTRSSFGAGRGGFASATTLRPTSSSLSSHFAISASPGYVMSLRSKPSRFRYSATARRMTSLGREWSRLAILMTAFASFRSQRAVRTSVNRSGSGISSPRGETALGGVVWGSREYDAQNVNCRTGKALPINTLSDGSSCQKSFLPAVGALPAL
jgi:hypothetical protein